MDGPSGPSLNFLAMKEEVAKLLLNGIPMSQFIAFYIAGLVGAIISYGINVGMAVKMDKTTSAKFKRSEFKVKFWRVIVAALSLAAGIIFNKEILGFLLDSEAVIELNLWSAFGVGMTSDRLGKKLTGLKR